MSRTSQWRADTWRRSVVVAVIAVLIWAGAPAPSAQAAPELSVDLKVLLISDGGSQTAAFAALMDREGVPYTTVNLGDGGRPTINDVFLANAATGRGHFQAVILPNQTGALPGNPAPVGSLTPAELTALANYERSYGVRQVDALVYPGAPTGQADAQPAWPGNGTGGPLDGAPATVTGQGLVGPFAYLKGPFTIDDFAPAVNESWGSLAEPSPNLPAGETFTPLVNATFSGYHGAIIGVYAHDLREELVITTGYNGDQQWFNEVGHGILTWMTRGVHLGYHRNYFAVHVDDIFMADGRWDSVQHCTPGDTPSCVKNNTDIRMDEGDVADLVNWQETNKIKLDMVFNAFGSDDAKAANGGSDPLTTTFLAAKDQFRWVNHTYSHAFLGCIQVQNQPITGNWHCAEPDEIVAEEDYYDPELVPGAVASDGKVWLSQAQIYTEINENRNWATLNDLPNFNRDVLVTGEHSGLRTPPQQPLDSQFFAAALTQAGITYTGSDVSRPNESDSRLVSGTTTRTLPRYPMNIFYNAGTYQDEVDEYNWIYTSEAVGGSGICTANPDTSTCIPKLDDGDLAENSFRNYIVPLEVRNAYRKVITNDPRPFYAHQSNLAEDQILYPVLDGVLNEYKSTYNTEKSPIKNLAMANLGDALNKMTDWNSVKSTVGTGVTAYIDATGVHVSGPANTGVPLSVPTGTAVTGVSAEPYDGELSGWYNATASNTLVANVTTTQAGYVGHILTVPDAPTNVVATSTEYLGLLNLAWTAPANNGNSAITGYEVQWSLATGDPEWTSSGPLDAGTTSYTAGGLVEGESYLFEVRAINAQGPSLWSAPLTTTTGHVVPDAPTNVSATLGTAPGSVDLTWSAATGDPNLPVTGYKIQRVTDTGEPVGDLVAWLGDVTNYTATGLPEGSSYIFQVSAFNALGDGPWSTSTTPVTVPIQYPAVPHVTSDAVPFGTAASITLTVDTAEGHVPSGTATLTIDGSAVPPQTFTGNSVTFSVPGLSVGDHAYTLVYGSDPNIQGFDWSGNVTVTKASVTAAGAVVAPPTTLQSGTYKVTVTQPNGLPTPTGAVTVTLTSDVGTTPPIPGALLDDGTVTVTVPPLAAGTWTAKVAYTGDGIYNAVDAADGGSVASSAVGPGTVAGTVTTEPTTQLPGKYTISVTPAEGLPAATGHVKVTLAKEGSATVGPLDKELVSGTATLDLPNLPAGEWAATIDYEGDGNYSAVLSVAGASVVSSKVAVSSVAGAVTTAPTTQQTGTYKVTVTEPTDLAKASGTVTVTFKSGELTKTVTDTLGADGTKVLTVPKLAAGTWTASITYDGDSNYAPATADGPDLNSAKVDVSSVVGVVATPPSAHEAGTYTVTVTEPLEPSGLAKASGTVTVSLTNGDLTEIIADTSVADGIATVTVPPLAVGTWTASIEYTGDSNYLAKTADGAPVVSTDTVRSTVVGSVTKVPTTQLTGTYTVTVTPAGLPKATGTVTVTLKSGSATQKVTGTLTAGAATLTLPKLAAGSWTPSIAYAGDANYTASTFDGDPFVVSKTAVSTVVGMVVTKPTTTKAGSYKITVTQPSGLAAAKGNVALTLKLGTATKTASGTLSGGTVTVSIPALAAGTWVASIAYAGDENYLPKTLAGASVVAAKTAVSKVTTSVTKVPTTKKAGTYKVTVAQPSGAAKATGKVTVTLKKGSTTKKVTGTLKSGAVTVTVPKLPKGIWKASVAYAGDATYSAKTVTGLSVVSGKTSVAKVSTQITKVPTSKKAGTYKVTVTQPKNIATPSGKVTVTLKKGKVTKKVTGTLKSGAVTVKVPKLAKGIWKVTVTYAGNSTYTAKKATGLSVVSGKTAVSKVATSVTKVPTTKATGTYKVTVTQAKGLAKATGKVTVTLKKGSVTKKVTGTLKAGVVTVAVPKLAKGTWKVSVAYAGDATFKAKKATGKSIVVKK